MTLAPMIGLRAVYSWAEVAKLLGFTKRQVRSAVEKGKLVRRYSGAYPFHQSDVNGFLTRLNCGEFEIGNRGRKPK